MNFIEMLSGGAPDGGDGSLELFLLFAFALFVLSLIALRIRSSQPNHLVIE